MLVMTGSRAFHRTATRPRLPIASFNAHEGEPREVPAWAREARHQPRLHRITHEGHNRKRAGRVFGRLSRLATQGHDDVHRQLDQLGGEGGEPIGLPRRTEFQGEVVPLHIAQLAQALLEGLRQGRSRAYSHGETHDPATFADGCASAASAAARRLRVSVTIHPTALHHMVISFGLLPTSCFPWTPNT